jgi:hypothetical protein
LAKDPSRARAAYRRFVESAVAGSPRSPLASVIGGMFLGSDPWIDRWRRRLAREPVRSGVPKQRQLAWRPTLEHVVDVVSEAFGVAPAEVLARRSYGNEARMAAIYLARQMTDAGVGTLGRYFGGVSTAAISQAVARVQRRRGEDRGWDRRLTTLAERLRVDEDA